MQLVYNKKTASETILESTRWKNLKIMLFRIITRHSSLGCKHIENLNDPIGDW